MCVDKQVHSSCSGTFITVLVGIPILLSITVESCFGRENNMYFSVFSAFGWADFDIGSMSKESGWFGIVLILPVTSQRNGLFRLE